MKEQCPGIRLKAKKRSLFLLSRGRRSNFLGKITPLLGAFPNLRLLGLIHFRKIKSGSAFGACPKRSPRMIDLSFDSVGIATGIEENSRTIAPLTSVIGADRLGVFLQHRARHRYMMQIAQW